MSAETAKIYKPYLFQPGKSGNPAGRARLPDDLRMIKALSKYEVARVISKFARMSMQEMGKALLDPKIKVLDLAIAKCFKRSIEKTDYDALNFLLDRAIGKVQPVEIDDAATGEDDLTNMSTSDLLKMIQNLLPKEQKADEVII